MGAPDERAFVTFQRGYVRDNILLASFRNDLRSSINPSSGITFTEDEVQRATAPNTRFYIEADAIDLLGMAQQSRAAFFAAQIDPRTANSEYLKKFHGALWLGDDSQLPAEGAGGPARATGTNGTIIPGSTTVPDAAAAVATDPNGLRYQNLSSVVITNGTALVSLIGLDTGFVTRLPVDTELRWSTNVNPGTDPAVIVTAPFDGGFDAETDEEYSARIVQRIRNRPASGNAAHFQAWAQESSTAVEQAFTYPTALSAGSTVVAITEKRPFAAAGVRPEGPDARIPSLSTLNTAAAYLTPPSSPVVPEHVFALTTGVVAQPSDLVMLFSMTSGRSGGWADAEPWPAYSASFPSLRFDTVSVNGLTLTLTTDQSLPGDAASLSGADAPKLMIFNREISRWVKLTVTSVTDASPGPSSSRTFTIVLTSLPTLYDEDFVARHPAATDHLSPYTDRADIIAQSLEAYFDQLGPGEVVDPASARFARAARQPAPSISYPSRAGQGVLRYPLAALGGSAADAELVLMSRTTPDLPTNLVDGPNMITFGHINIFAF